MTTAETYVTAAYLVFLGVVLLYVVIYSFRIAHLERALADLTQDAAPPYAADESEPQPEPAVAT